MKEINIDWQEMSNPVFYYMWEDGEHGFIYRRYFNFHDNVWERPHVYCDFHGEEDLDYLISEIKRFLW